MRRIIVTGAGGPAASNFINSLRLSEDKYYIVGVDSNKFHLELTNNLDEKYIVPNVISKNYLEKINKLIFKEKIDLIYPQTDVEVRYLSKNKERINTSVFLPSYKTVQICQDKAKSNRILKDAGVSVPSAVGFVNKLEFIENFKKIKSNRYYWLRAVRGAGSKAALPIKTIDQGVSWINYWKEQHGLDYKDFMLSEFLPGREYAFQSIWKNGELIVSSARERIEYLFGNLFVSGQSSSPSIAKTVHSKMVNDISYAAIRAIDKNASGVFCIDLKENLLGVPSVTEINVGRFFTTSNFFAHAGVNMPDIYIKTAFGDSYIKQKQFNAVSKNIYWIRLMDMGYKIVKNDKWSSKKI